jgi:signal transduction histidine kinase
VLVVDDSPANIEMLSLFLQKDYRVKIANSGKKALEVANSPIPPALILLDVMMPEMSGFDVCLELKKNPATQKIPVIFVTAKGDASDITNGFKVGGVDYITKPISSAVVRARVRIHLALSDQNKALEGLVVERTRQLQKVHQTIQRMNAELELQVEKRTAELSAANQALARASRLKDEFLSSMSHELRTPLTAILNISEALQEEVYGPLNEKQLKSMRTVEDSGRHLLGLINDILDLSKIEAGRFELQIDEFSLNLVFQGSVQLVNELAKTKSQIITTSCQPENLILRADSRRIKQMVVNLLSNAIKFTPFGGMIGLSAEADKVSQIVRITVMDNGIGISEEDIQKLFQPFIQLDSSLARQQAGTGLGLALVRSMANLHGGSVTVNSTPGKGSAFTITLPWANSGEAVVPIKKRTTGLLRKRSPEFPNNSPEQSPIILIADDNETNRNIFSDYLNARGFQVISASDGKEAARKASEMRPDLILMDIQMPGFDGLQATRKIRKHPDPHVATIPIIAFTALTMPGDRERSLEAGANDYLSKPVSLPVLIKTIETWLMQEEKGG